ncbi:MAG: MBL fold metallo-hydrolase [Verrucomicrobia bacterium]|nr:MBL fold metallo-hydrolase [Verrucomicrobiota bacterium]MBU1733713.1 MBL fold metallo-hydrolase [Verrucomicrobiota bacterium]MBU1856553.1 MBL fold metallo-hydrolase [Verrucomicrobiota bacterium]
MSVTFLGAAQNVTGSSYAVDVDDTTVLVDCGLYQERSLRDRNWAAFPVSPARIKAVLLTHAHLDHCGLLPKLVREGFRGKVYCTPATAEIVQIVLLDSAKIQEEDALTKAKRHAKEGRRGPHPDLPLYTIRDAEAVLPFLTPVAYGTPVSVASGIKASFFEAGHILGSAMIKLDLSAAPAELSAPVERSILFTGDLGRCHLPILQDPAVCRAADYVVMESTYGDRVHEATEDIPDALARILNATRQAGGKVVIPAFAIERTQELIYYLSALLRAKKIPRLPVFLDSPMAIRVTEVFNRHKELFDEEAKALMGQGTQPYEFPGMTFTSKVDESKAINKVRGPAVIIAGSGMCNGGRIKYHLANTISRPENTVLFVGYQAMGTLGREILDGAKKVRILGQWHQVRARVEQLHGFSAHADREELLTWLKACAQPPRHIFVTHGEAATALAFAALVQEKTGWSASAPAYNQREILA